MAKRILKYTLRVQDLIEVEMPAGARILSVQAQEDYRLPSEVPCVWALVDPEAELVVRRFRTFATGANLEKAEEFSEPYATYVGTYQLDHGRFVAHVFDLGQRSNEK